MSTTVEALQATLVAEHAAVWMYATIGGLTSESAHPDLFATLTECHRQHRARRDRLTAMLLDRGQTPEAAAPAYRLPNPAATPEQVIAIARQVEDRCAATYATLVASTSRTDRTWAIGLLTDAAVREVGFGGRPTAFPGMTELG